jgi:hypothetical protein
LRDGILGGDLIGTRPDGTYKQCQFRRAGVDGFGPGRDDGGLLIVVRFIHQF